MIIVAWELFEFGGINLYNNWPKLQYVWWVYREIKPRFLDIQQQVQLYCTLGGVYTYTFLVKNKYFSLRFSCLHVNEYEISVFA